MSILSLKDFANAVGISYDTAKKHAQRKKIYKGTDGKIDTENPLNISYIQEQTKGSGLFRSSHTVEVKESKVTEKPKERILSNIEQMHLDLDLRKKKAEAEKAERDNELKRVQLEKIAGKLLPVELVERIFTINIQAVFKNFELESENLARLYVLDRKKLAEVNQKQKILLSNIIEKSKEDAKFEIENAIMDYQETRSRGERKI
jgi:hypothetical protein